MVASKTVAKRVSAVQRSSAAEPASTGLDGSRRTLPVIEERPQVHARSVDKGGYRLTKQMDSHQETVDELLRDHHVVVERRPIGRTLEGTDIPEQRYERDVLIIPVVEEILVIEKRLVLVEEVRATRIHGTHRKPQQVTLRKEHISVERLDPEDLPPPSPRNPPTP